MLPKPKSSVYKLVATDNDQKLRSEACNKTLVKSNMMTKLLELDSDGDNVVWTHCGAVR